MISHIYRPKKLKWDIKYPPYFGHQIRFVIQSKCKKERQVINMTTNSDYITKQIQNSQIIWIDTCTMMYIQRFELFIKNVRPILLESNKKIQIPDCVMAELAKHQLSSDEYKQTSATEALSLIKANNDIFKVEHLDNDASNGENFADPKILTVIPGEKKKHTTTAYINDQRLTSDAYKFNNLESFYGSKVSVCYIGANGDMNMCDCVKSKPTKEQPEIIYKDRVVEKKLSKKFHTIKLSWNLMDYLLVLQ